MNSDQKLETAAQIRQAVEQIVKFVDPKDNYRVAKGNREAFTEAVAQIRQATDQLTGEGQREAKKSSKKKDEASAESPTAPAI